jgi:hypothetical protein
MEFITGIPDSTLQRYITEISEALYLVSLSLGLELVIILISSLLM